MAIGKLSKGSYAAGLIDYLLGACDHSGDVRPVVRIVGGTMGFTSKDAKAQFEAFANLRPSLVVNVVHNSISLPTSDRDLSPEEWAKIGDVWACGMGFEGYVTVCHGNHIHIAASRIKLDGSVVSDAHDYRRSEALIREIEERFALAKVDASHLIDPDRTHTHITAPKTAEIAMASKGQASAKGVLQSLLTELTSAPITASDFVFLLEAQGVDVRPNISETTGRLAGFAFALDGHTFTAAALGRGFTLANLLKKGFSYEQNRDFAALVSAKERSDAKASGGSLKATRQALAVTFRAIEALPQKIEAAMIADHQRMQANDQTSKNILFQEIRHARKDLLVIIQLTKIAQKTALREVNAMKSDIQQAKTITSRLVWGAAALLALNLTTLALLIMRT